MKFKKIILNNLFSYYGPVEFDLTGGDETANIVLISGRNGYGKTSFIRSLKLLFAGTPEFLAIDITGRSMGQKRFVMGDGKNWLGIMNRKAVNKGQTRCSVCIEWVEPGAEVKAKRIWDLTGKNFLGELIIIHNGERLREKDAREFIDQRLPSAYIPFFFFDSEQIERLVESTDKESFKTDMERLLDIAPIDYIRDELKTVAKEWQQDAMEEEKRLALFETQEQLKKEELAIAVEDEKQRDWEDQKNDLDQEISEIEKELKSLEYLRNRQDTGRLNLSRDKAIADKENMAVWLADLIKKESPLLANPSLVEKAGKYLEKAAGNKLGEAAEILESLKKSLVPGLLDEPPYPNPELEPSQKRFLKKRLIGLIDARIPDSDTGMLSLEVKRAKHLHEQFIQYRGMDNTREEIKRTLVQIHNLTRDIASIEFDIAEAVGLTNEERERIDLLSDTLKEKTEELGGIKRELQNSQAKKENYLRNIQQLKKEIRNQEKQVELSKRTRKKVNLAKDLRVFFNQYKQELKRLKRGDVEATLEKYAKILISNLPQVNKILVSENFELTYMDDSNNEVGRTNLSSGNKQLVATALLWALKTVSKKDVPVVIDTPLGRLDAINQKSLLENYYPYVGEQVILLPTDSELDKEKYKLLLPHVYKEYRLENKDGESTNPVLEQMYPGLS